MIVIRNFICILHIYLKNVIALFTVFFFLSFFNSNETVAAVLGSTIVATNISQYKQNEELGKKSILDFTKIEASDVLPGRNFDPIKISQHRNNDEPNDDSKSSAAKEQTDDISPESKSGDNRKSNDKAKLNEPNSRGAPPDTNSKVEGTSSSTQSSNETDPEFPDDPGEGEFQPPVPVNLTTRNLTVVTVTYISESQTWILLFGVIAAGLIILAVILGTVLIIILVKSLKGADDNDSE